MRPLKSGVCLPLTAQLLLDQPYFKCSIAHVWPGESELINWIKPLHGPGSSYAVKTNESPRSKDQEISHKNSVSLFRLAKPKSGSWEPPGTLSGI